MECGPTNGYGLLGGVYWKIWQRRNALVGARWTIHSGVTNANRWGRNQQSAEKFILWMQHDYQEQIKKGRLRSWDWEWWKKYNPRTGNWYWLAEKDWGKKQANEENADGFRWKIKRKTPLIVVWSNCQLYWNIDLVRRGWCICGRGRFTPEGQIHSGGGGSAETLITRIMKN